MNIGISHPLDASNHSPVEALRQDVAAPVDLQFHGKHQPFHARLERANLGGKFERQHGDRAIRKIHAGAAQEGLFIDRAAGLHIVAHIGDVDLERIIAVRHAIHPDRIVEIARRLAIDGHDVQRAIILASGQLILADDVGKSLRLLQNLRRKMMGDVMFPDHDLDVDAEIDPTVEDLDHRAPPRTRRLRETRESPR